MATAANVWVTPDSVLNLDTKDHPTIFNRNFLDPRCKICICCDEILDKKFVL